jgi:ABC-type transport system involved in Fe-S cluster assembly fused permease/ATPase subunit
VSKDSGVHWLTSKDGTRNIWLPGLIYAVLLFINGGAGIDWIRKWLWLPLEQYSYAAISTASQAHMLSLSSDFHDSKTTSDLMQAITGGRSVTYLLETICFQVVPMFIDLAIAFAYLWSLFGPFMGLILAATFFSYLYITTKLVAMRAENRRQYVAGFRKEWTIGHQSLEGWNTASVGFFNVADHP